MGLDEVYKDFMQECVLQKKYAFLLQHYWTVVETGNYPLDSMELYIFFKLDNSLILR